MRVRSIAAWSGAAVLGATLALPIPAVADPTPAPSGTATSAGRGAGTAAAVAPAEKAAVAQRAAAAPSVENPIVMPTSYPFQPELRFYRDNADDAADTANLRSHADIAPELTELMARSNRVSTQVVGQSTEGRDLYLITLTMPESEAETARQAAWKDLIKNDPDAAATDTTLTGGYKVPIWISNNIHGNEWEGTDAAMDYIDYLATAPLSEVGSILANNRIYFSPSLNPDGRTNATRATALGLDPNRDMITNTTPETNSFIRTAQAVQPIYAADFHGYTRVLQMEPCGPPHGSNYEYDLYIPHNYALALRVERDVVAANIPGNTYYDTTTGAVSAVNTGNIKIPYRDTPDGWDDFPPIFTAQYAAFFGAASATVELPLQRNLTVNGTSRMSPDRAAVNSAVALQTMESIVGYMNVATNARDMINNQIEVFRRGVAGEPKDNLTVSDVPSVPGPTQWQPLWDVADDQEPITLPRAYVIPTGADQRSASDAADLVEHLLRHDIEVGRLTSPATVGSTTYPAGSYVVDMHQPLRGLANSLLDLGEDISAKVPTMYDVSAWSLGNIWGATVDKVGLTEDETSVGATEPVTEVSAPAAPAAPDYLSFDLAGVSDYEVVNALLDDDVAVSMLEDGSVVVDAAGYEVAVAAAAEAGVALEEASAEDLAALDDEDTKPLSDLTIAYVGTQDDRLSLTELGFDDLRVVTATTLNANPALMDGVDVLWVASSFVPSAVTQPAARTAVQSFLDDGGALLGRTSNAFNAAVSFGLMTGTVTNGNGSGNGIVAVDTPAGSVLEPYAQDASFIYPAFSFSALGEGVTAEQSYDAEAPFLAGHWRGTNATNGPEFAAGKASVVSSENATTGAKSLVFGTSVFFRTHPRGGLSQAARALFWAAPEGTAVVAPEATTLTLTADGPVAFPGDVDFEVTAAAASPEAGTPAGSVAILDADGATVGSGTLVGGEATVTVAGLRPGLRSYTAEFTPSSPSFEAASSAPVELRINRARSTTSMQVVGSTPRGVRVTVGFDITGLASRGDVLIRDRGVVVRTVRFRGADSATVVVQLPAGRHRLQAVFPGDSTVMPSRSAVRMVATR